ESDDNPIDRCELYNDDFRPGPGRPITSCKARTCRLDYHRFLFRARPRHRVLSEEALEHWRGFLPRWPRNDGVDRRPYFSLGEPGRARTHGLGFLGLRI